MKCKRIKEILITDYIDGQLSKALQEKIDEHLKICEQCREFEQLLQKKVIAPFKEAEQLQPPEFLWSRIRESVTAPEEQAQTVMERLGRSFHNIFIFRKPVLSAATVMAVILLAVIFTRIPFNGSKATNIYLEEQIEFLSSLDTEDPEHIDFGTSIEEFLM